MHAQTIKATHRGYLEFNNPTPRNQYNDVAHYISKYVYNLYYSTLIKLDIKYFVIRNIFQLRTYYRYVKFTETVKMSMSL
jgi:hypothetical protein